MSNLEVTGPLTERQERLSGRMEQTPIAIEKSLIEIRRGFTERRIFTGCADFDVATRQRALGIIKKYMPQTAAKYEGH